MKQTATRTMFSYWDKLRGERAAPERSEIEPGAIRDILADTFILELDAERSAHFRLAGTRLCALFGGELRNRPLASLWAGHSVGEVNHYVDMVVEDTAGLVLGVTGVTQDDTRLDLEMLLLPLRHRGKPHVRVLGALTPASLPSWIGLQPLAFLETDSLRVIASKDGRHLQPAARGGAPQDAGGRVAPPDAVGKIAPRGAGRFVVYRGGRA